MSAGKGRGMQIAADMARRKRDAAAADLNRGRAAERAAHHQFEQLTNYARDTESRWTEQARVLATPELMTHHYQFMTRLHHAIGLQRDVLQQHARQIELLTGRVREAELRLKSLQMVIDRQRLDAEKVLARREQKQTDEMAANLFRRTAAAVLEEGSSR
ncbi:flagellar export protein FliJ [Xylophilus sp. GOD-11R]|uniref:flagellar export protein FliJ n=1 Tax=Xylophilus sp. GOD-11R TaxID=3089814 RepID=UPI00298D54D7|nr:flagellar export protein FliJ [Xylophilus sp. GOD-11R]WPB57782.1 flagellar export protein FliJ [Xylophilus sp. GOD-11R]